MTAISPCCGCP